MRWVVLLIACYGATPSIAIDRSAFTFTKYDLEARIETQQQRLGIRGIVALRNDSNLPQRSFTLQISSTLNWLSIRLGGKPAQFVAHPYTSDIDHTGAVTEAIVTLPGAVSPAQTIEVQVAYEGTVPQDFTRLSRSGVPEGSARRSDWDRISKSFTAIRGIGYVAWYPVSMESASLSGEGEALASEIGRWKRRESNASMAIDLCSGSGVALMNDEGGTGVAGSLPDCKRHSYARLGDTVPVIAIGDYSASGKSEAQVYYLAGDQSAWESYSLALEEAAVLVNGLFGSGPPPLVTPRAIDLADPEAAPFESGNTMFIPLTAKDSTLLLAAAQQLANLRFSSSQAWIRSGLARYAQLSLLAQRGGAEAEAEYLKSQNDQVRSLERTANSTGAAEENSLIESVDELYVTAKAGSVWWMLKETIGEVALKSALHAYNESDNHDPAYVQKLMESQTHRDLSWVFDDWVYRDTGLPDFSIDSVYPRKLESGGFMVTVSVRNSGRAGAEVPVMLRTATGTETQRVLVRGNSTASVRVHAGAMPTEAVVNDGSVPETDASNNSFQIRSAPSQ
jgi:hypothetical protein